MVDISVKFRDGKYFVTVIENSSSRHEVTVSDDFYHDLTDDKISPIELVKRSFLFLLDREPKEAILAKFDLKVISRYFSEYENVIRGGL